MSKISLKNRESILRLANDAYLNLGDVSKLVLTNPLISDNQFDIENPHIKILRLMRNPDYFWFTCKWLLNIDLLPFQVVILRELWYRKFPMIIGSRGCSKSFLLSIYAVLRALFTQGSKVVIVGAAFRQSKILFEYMENFYRDSQVFHNIVGKDKKEGPKTDTDRCTFYIGKSVINSIPLGDGSKIRGLRATHTLAEEFAAIPEETFETVVGGFSAVNLNPVELVKQRAKINLLKSLQIDTTALTNEEDFGNQTVFSGTAYYAFNHFFKYFEKWRKIINSRGNIDALEKVFDGDIPTHFDWRHYGIVRLPYSKLPSGFMDEATVSRAKATVHTSTYMMEYEAVFAKDSDGFFKRSLIESCVSALLNDSTLAFSAQIKGNPNAEYIYGVDTASEIDNFAIVILEKCGPINKIVHCWVMNRQRHRDRVKRGLAKEHDFFDYCSRKIRELMKIFPTRHIALDAQGGGRTIMEVLQDPSRLRENEHRLLPYTKDPQDNFWWEKEDKPTDGEPGLHILHSVEFANAKFTAEANHGLKKDFEMKQTLFPYFDPFSIAEAIQNDKARGIAQTEAEYKLYDTLEDCVMDIEELKDELATIKHTTTGTRDRWDTPETVVNGKKGHLRKDRYSALLIANMISRTMNLYNNRYVYEHVGGYAGQKFDKDKPKGQLYYGNAKYLEQINSSSYGMGVNKNR